MADEAKPPSDEELLDQFRQLRVADLLTQTATMLVSLAEGKLQTKELDEARLAIDALRALGPVLAETVPPDYKHALENAISGLQLSFASAASPASEPTD